ncbi:MAG: protein kinase/lanthionine synthetase C family protein [Actinobacteria bacterium]|nr:protein kinase/lanthionine synthetase C family protein [Actinomycetota bacterium]
MNADHEAFCLTDPVFYDAPAAGGADGSLLAAIERTAPDGWDASTAGVWTVIHHEAIELPKQGWKIHVSASVTNALDVLTTTWDHCVERGLCFKFLSTQAAFLAKNAKYADRSGSGKFITIYPVNEQDLERCLAELGAELSGEPGPYILSDVRWNEGPLYVRYGGFVSMECTTATGEIVPAIEDPDGNLVPDVRAPRFSAPGWVAVPSFLMDAISERTSDSGEPLPYRIEQAMHFSNGGGVYLASDPETGARLVLKEARPLAGLDGAGTDAVARLEREHRILSTLAGLDCVPAVHERRTLWEHHFLVEEYVEGTMLADELSQRHPMISARPDGDAISAYCEWAVSAVDAVDAAVRAVHARGVVIGDLHPRNVIVRPDGRVCLVDFELGHRVDEDFDRTLGAAGYAAPADRTGFAIDRFALGALRLALFLPFVELVPWDPAKLDELIGAVEARFPVPSGFGEAVRRDLGEIVVTNVDRAWRDEIWPRQGLPRWEQLRTSMARAINASATPDRTDRLFPGDPQQFAGDGGGLAMAFGAAGVVWALHETSAPVDSAHLDWLVRTTMAADDLRPGFYDGATGIAYALDRCGRHTEALDALARVFEQPLDPDDLSLYSGIAGIGLALLHFHRTAHEPRYLDLAIELATHGISRLDDESYRAQPAGLMRGWSGLALFMLRLHEHTADPALLDAAERAVRADLDRCTRTDGGTVQVDDGWRVLPYLDVGSAGIGIVLRELLDRVPDETLAQQLDGIRLAATGDVVIQSGLFNGRAGLLLFLRSLQPVPAADVEAHVACMAWHAAPYEGHVAFVGDGLARLSMDLATGSAGVLLALGSALGERPLSLPFLRSEPWAPRDDVSLLVSPASPRALERR